MLTEYQMKFNFSSKPSDSDASIFQLFKSRNNSKYLLQGMCSLFFLNILVFILGFSFVLIFFGMFMLVPRLALFWEPAYNLITKLVGADQEETPFKPVKFYWWLVPVVLPQIFFGYLIVGFGIWILIDKGFLGQNLIYGIFR